MYEVPKQEARPGCRDAWVVSLAVFAVIAPIVGVAIALLAALTAAIFLFTVHPVLALVPIALAVAGVYAFARWEQSRFRPPGL